MNNLLRHADLFDNDFFFGGNERNLMKTDIRELENDYVIEIEVPGVKKEDITISLDKEYLTVNAKISSNEEEKSKKYLHHERFVGNYSRSYYVGNIDQKDVKAAFENGVLSISFPKESKKEETSKLIQIN